MKHTNQLIHESSPYLLQHAHNPVDWLPWGNEALTRAKTEDKPILVSIGYAACHWCHVMERESFENEFTANFMNQHFICIKIDREERPDLDHFFMDALQAISGNGGWPLNMFLTSDAKPFYGGTYFPPMRVHNRPSWLEVLSQIHQAFQSRRKEIEDQAENLLNYLTKSNQTTGFSNNINTDTSLFSMDHCQKAFEAIMGISDKVYGGFGKAPKFPQTFAIQFLLRYHHFTGDKEALQQAELSLKSMMRGGIYDQIGGGFCRYSTDATWLAPHFEKMTYDNALLLICLSEAFQLNRNPEYKKVAVQTIDFMKREMMSADFGFYAALDADSEGEEGKYYTWAKKEFEEVLKEDAAVMADWFDITAEGNWEGVNIPRTKMGIEEWAKEKGLDIKITDKKIQDSINLLLAERQKRVRPGTDDKIILGWNALFNDALVKAALAFKEPEWLNMAEQNMKFLLKAFKGIEDQWLHTYKNGTARFSAFLDDLSFLVQALITLYEPTGNLVYLEKARTILHYIQSNYTDENGIFFYYTPSFQKDVMVRKKDIYDGAMPSSNAIMAWNLYKAGILLGEDEWKRQSAQMLITMREGVIKYPNSFGVWANLMLEMAQGTHEILVLGPEGHEKGTDLLTHYIPNKVVMLASELDDRYPLMQQKSITGETLYYVCRDYSCQLPQKDQQAVLLKVLTK